MALHGDVEEKKVREVLDELSGIFFRGHQSEQL